MDTNQEKWNKLAIFRCAECVKDLEQFNPYVFDNGQPVDLEHLEIITVPESHCENHYTHTEIGTPQNPIRLYDGVIKPYILSKFETFDQAIKSTSKTDNEEDCRSFDMTYQRAYERARSIVETSEVYRAIKISVKSLNKEIGICVIGRANDGKVTTLFLYH